MAAEADNTDPRATLLALYHAAVGAAHPDVCLPPHLPRPPDGGRLVIVGAGKAAAAMAITAEAHYRKGGVLDRISGFTTPPHAALEALTAERPSTIEIFSARHPTPDAASQRAAEKALDLVASATNRDLVLVLLSGGASSLWAAPAAGLDLETKIALTRALLKCGADIHETNTVRRHISRIKGGRLRKATTARMLTLAISDVPGDDPATIGSGPTVPDPTTLADARAVLERRRPAMEALGLAVPAAVAVALADPANETPKPNDPAFASAEYRIIATPAAALAAAGDLARRGGYEVIDLGDSVAGEAREVAQRHVRLAHEVKAAGRRAAIISGGELSVTVRDAKGRGGRCQEYALALAIALDGEPGITALAADTDGIDGGEGKVSDPAGAIVDPTTLGRARHLDAQMFLDNNDATSYFEAAGGLIVPGPTQTNVNDFRAILKPTPMPPPQSHPRKQARRASAATRPRSRRQVLVTLASAAVSLLGACDQQTAARSPPGDLKLCNTTSSRVGVAIGYQDSNGWTTEGWWNVAAQTCETLFKGTLASRFYYVHAVDYDRGGEWAGKSVMCTADKSFTIRGVQDCERRGYKGTGFFEVDTQDAKAWTIRLTDPSEGGAKTK